MRAQHMHARHVLHVPILTDVAVYIFYTPRVVRVILVLWAYTYAHTHTHTHTWRVLSVMYSVNAVTRRPTERGHERSYRRRSTATKLRHARKLNAAEHALHPVPIRLRVVVHPEARDRIGRRVLCCAHLDRHIVEEW